jgi:N-acetylglucosaminyl-diphospho-decaprenol L-rhamnosyltransferase
MNGAWAGSPVARVDQLQPSPVLVISPHLDDAVLSCGELLFAHSGSTVITVFAGRPAPDRELTEWDAASGFQRGDDVVGMRREEDAMALAVLSARPVWLDFLDSQYGRTPPMETLVETLDQAIRATALHTVFMPLGLFHSDHQLVSQACLAVMARLPGLTWFAYEDALYRTIDNLVQDRLRDMQAGGIAIELEGGSSGTAAESKRQALFHYASQLRALETEGRPGYKDALNGEHYWRLSLAGAGGRPAGSDPRVGVVVLTHNRVKELSATLQRLTELPEQPTIVVVDNASTDGSSEMIRARFPDVVYARMADNLGAAGRNVGVRVCDRPYVALCDDDTWWEPGSLRRAADLLDGHAALAVISGRVLVGENGRVDPTCTAMAESPLPWSPELPGRALLGFLAGASIVRRSAFLSAGGFNRRFFVGGEEELLAYDLADAGWRLAYVDDLVIHHNPSPIRDVARRRRTLLRNHLWVAWLRRPAGRAIKMTFDLLRRSKTDPVSRRAVLEAGAGLRWVLRARRALRPEVENGIRLLEQAGIK